MANQGVQTFVSSKAGRAPVGPLATEPYNVISFVLTESMMNHQTFSGKSTSIGNSKGFRFDAALFKANPEFFGEVRGTVLAPGQMLVSVVPMGEQQPELQDEEANPVMQAFLSFLVGQMAAHPELIEPVTEAQMAHIATLVEGVEPD